MKRKVLVVLAIACTIASAIFLKDITIGIVTIPIVIGLSRMTESEWNELQKRG